MTDDFFRLYTQEYSKKINELDEKIKQLRKTIRSHKKMNSVCENYEPAMTIKETQQFLKAALIAEIIERLSVYPQYNGKYANPDDWKLAITKRECKFKSGVVAKGEIVLVQTRKKLLDWGNDYTVARLYTNYQGKPGVWHYGFEDPYFYQYFEIIETEGGK